MNPELQALEQMLQLGNKAKGNLAGLDEQYATADALRTKGNTKANKYGYDSPFQALADNAGRAQGHIKAREVAPQRESARADVAKAASALPMFQARKAQTAIELAAANRTESRGWQTDDTTAANEFTADQNQIKAGALVKSAKATAEAKLAKELKDRGYVEGAGTLVTKVSPDGKEHTIRYNKDTKKAYKDDVEITNFSDWIDPPTKTQDIPSAGYGIPSMDKEAVKSMIIMGNANRVADKGHALSEDAKKALNSGQNRLGQIMLRSFTPKAASALVLGEFSPFPQEAKEFVMSVSRMSAEERHELFGAALTQGEEESGKDFLARVEGLTFDQMMSRMGDTFSSHNSKLDTYDVVGRGSSWADARAEAGWTAFDPRPEPEPAPPPALVAPEGIDMNNEAALDEFLRMHEGQTQ